MTELFSSFRALNNKVYLDSEHLNAAQCGPQLESRCPILASSKASNFLSTNAGDKNDHQY